MIEYLINFQFINYIFNYSIIRIKTVGNVTAFTATKASDNTKRPASYVIILG